MREVTRIILHWEGSGNSRTLDNRKVVDNIRMDHIQRGWGDIAYHWLIGDSGCEYVGRPENIIGTHALGANTGSIGICMLYGTLDKKVSDAAINTLVKRITTICKMYKFSPTSKSILGHKDISATDCPGIIYPLIPSIITKCKGIIFQESPILLLPPETAEIRRIKAFDSNGKEYRALMINSQTYIYATDAAIIAGKRLEWDNVNKQIKFKEVI